ncbi:MAG: translocation/assembly module TamB domain-containing protein, partial [Steroidobacteraceae bacterium]
MTAAKAMLRRLLLATACLLILVLAVMPAALIVSAVYTTAGLRFIVAHLPQHLGPVRLTIVGVSGTIARGLHVERVEIDHQRVHLRFEGIDGRVALAPLLLQTIRSPEATVHRALIEVKRRTRPPTPSPLIFLPRWLLISAEHATVDDAVLTVPNGFRLEATHVSGAAVIRHSSIRFFDAQGQLGAAHVAAIGELRAADPLRIEAHGHLEWNPPGQPGWTVHGSARGDLDALSVVAHCVSPFRADLAGEALDLTRHAHWVGDAVLQNFDLNAWGAAGPLGSITGRLALAGDAQGFSAHGKLDPAGLHAGVFDVQFAGSFADRVLTAKRMQARNAASGAQALGSGTIAIVAGGPRLDLRGSWENFRWPLTGRDPAVRSAAGSFSLAGVLPYRVHVQGSARAADLPQMPLEVSGTLGRDSFAFEPAEVDLLGGHASLRGEVVWAPRRSWTVAGRATGINPASLRADLPGSVNFTVAASGRGFGPGSDLSATVGELGGKLRGVRASGGGTLTHSGTAWTFDKLRVGLGSTLLALDGRVGEQLELRFALSTEDLNLLAPGSRGQLNAAGTVRGTPGSPAIAASVHGRGIHYQDVTLDAVDADVDFNPAAAQQESKIDARLHNLTYGKRTLESLALTVNGPPSAYRVQLGARASGLVASAQASGGYSSGLFQGQLTALTVKGKDTLNLALEHPVALSASLQRLRVEWLCLAGTPGAVCADADWSPAQWSATLMSHHLPLSALTAGRTPAVQYQGTIDALLHVAGAHSGPVTGTLRAQLADAVLSHKLVSNKIEHTRIGAGTVSVTATPALVSAAAVLENGDVGTIRARLDAQRGNAQWQDMPLSGALHAHTVDLDLLSLYFPDIDRAAGELTADVNVAGTLGAPRLAGVVKLSAGELDLYQVNLGLRQVGFEARLGDGGLDFKGSAHAGAGSATAGGHLEWRGLLPYGKLQLQGANLRVADIPEAQIDASPDLSFDIAGRRIEVTGKVAIPYAKIQPKDIANAVRTSPDEAIVGSEAQGPAQRFEVRSTITLSLGERVSVDAAGLTGRLAGGVTIRSGYDAITRGTGELSVVNGQYLAYARKLDIKTGRLIFTGGAIDDPGVDLRAVKV